MKTFITIALHFDSEIATVWYESVAKRAISAHTSQTNKRGTVVTTDRLRDPEFRIKRIKEYDRTTTTTYKEMRVFEI